MPKKNSDKKKEKGASPYAILTSWIKTFDALSTSVFKITELMLRLQGSVVQVEKIMKFRFKELEFNMNSYLEKLENKLGMNDEKEKIIH